MTAATPASRYDTIVKLASGGMATVWVGTVRGAFGFRQLVAIKKPHPHLLANASFRSELVAEARLASMIHHANVVDVRDVEIDGESISLVMDYIEGASLAEMLVKAAHEGGRLSPRVAVRVVLDALAGLHAAHELVDERGRFVGLVHRDISPQNILVGTDGISRVADFGVAKFARKNMASTSEGSLKGKLAYMAPEYVRGEAIDRRFDIFAMGVVFWEALAGKRCFRGENEADTLNRLLTHEPEPISKLVPELGTALDDVIACALAKSREARFDTAAAMVAALERSALGAGLLCGHSEVAAAVKAAVGAALEERRSLVRARLANEPSVASMIGLPPLVAGAADGAGAPPTELDPSRAAPPAATFADTPKQGGGLDLPAGVPATVTDPALVPPTATAGVVTAGIPATTLPLTPRMDGAPEHPPNAQVKTLASPERPSAGASAPDPRAATLLAAAAPPGPVVQSATHPSAGAMVMSPAPAAPAARPSERSFSDESVRSARSAPRSRPWLLPLVVGVTTAGIATAGILVSTRAGQAPVTDPSASASAGASSSSSSSSAPGAAAALASGAASVAGSAPSASGSAAAEAASATTGASAGAVASAKPGGRAATTKGAAGRGTAAPQATAAEAPTAPTAPTVPHAAPEPTRKAPPPNPYQDPH